METGVSIGKKPNPKIDFLKEIDTPQFSSVQFSHSVISDSATPWTAARQASLSKHHCLGFEIAQLEFHHLC